MTYLFGQVDRLSTCNYLIFFLLALFINVPVVASENPHLIKDINTLPLKSDSICGVPVEVNGIGFFCAIENQPQLWQTDGTTDGTKPVTQADGLVIQYPSDLVSSGSLLYFTISRELWRTDGTPQGTKILKDEQGRAIEPTLMTDVDGELFFFRFNLLYDGSLSFLHELWKTDGSDASTKQVKLFPTRLDPNDAAAINGELFFTNYEHQLWKSDGTEQGTVLLKDMEGRNYRTDNNNLTDVDGVLFFSLENDNDQFDLWKSDGTTEGTVLVAENVSDKFFTVTNFTDVSGLLYFTAEVDYTDTAIWTSDGSTAGTRIITILPGTSPSQQAAALGNQFLVVVGDGLVRTVGTVAGTVMLAQKVSNTYYSKPVTYNGFLYFSSDNGTGLGQELWKTAGTIASTNLVRDIAWQEKSSFPGFFASIDAGLILQANKGDHLGGPALWISKGTAYSTQKVKDVAQLSYGSFPSAITAVGNEVYFLANMTRTPLYNQLWQLWKSDGSEAGTHLVIDLIPERTSSSQYFGDEYASLVEFNNLLYLTGRDDAGWALWRTKGSPASTERLSDVLPADSNGPVTDLTVFGGNLFFFASVAGGEGLWRLGPNETSATLLQRGLTTPYNLTVLQGQLVFVNSNNELWRSDGAVGGTNKIETLPIGADAMIDEMQPVNDLFIFRAQWNYNYEGFYRDSALWVSDGTESGTYPLTSPYPESLVVGDKGIMYDNDDGLWVSDGTPSGTNQIADLVGIRNLIDINGTAYFTSGDFFTDNSFLWKSDWTTAGTVVLKSGLFIIEMAKIIDELYFSAYDAAPGGGYFSNSLALWKSDGTTTGTVVVKPGLYLVQAMDVPQNNLFIGAETDKPTQIWETDGTGTGTLPITSLPEAYAKQFQNSLVVNDRLFMNVDDTIHGIELWLLELTNEQSFSGILGDWAWWDVNEDGVQDAGEPGLAGVTISLEDCEGNPIDSKPSASDGSFRFENLPAGDYRLRFTPLAGYMFSPRANAGDYSLDSTPQPHTGLTTCKPLLQGQRRLGLDAGFIKLVSGGQMGDQVWLDADADGVRDSIEPGFSNVTVNLEDCMGNILQSEVTDSNGRFVFARLGDGHYQLRYIAPPGYAFSPKNIGGDYRLDSNADPATGLSGCRSISSNQHRMALDAGMIIQSGDTE